MKKKNYKEQETLQRKGKLRYLERLAEEEEADEEIKQYKPAEKETYPDNDIQDKIR